MVALLEALALVLEEKEGVSVIRRGYSRGLCGME